MKLEEIKKAVAAGHIVCWATDSYRVIKDNIGQWLIHCTINDGYIGLTHADGVTLNGREDQFFLYRMPQEEYAEGGDEPMCPCCLNCDMYFGGPEVRGVLVHRNGRCNKCQTEITEIYQLTGYEEKQ